MEKHVRDFTDACHENSLEELKIAAKKGSCYRDMRTWGLTRWEWTEAVFTAIKEKESDCN